MSALTTGLMLTDLAFQLTIKLQQLMALKAASEREGRELNAEEQRVLDELYANDRQALVDAIAAAKAREQAEDSGVQDAINRLV